jgi:hypothetical protein
MKAHGGLKMVLVASYNEFGNTSFADVVLHTNRSEYSCSWYSTESLGTCQDDAKTLEQRLGYSVKQDGERAEVRRD